MKAHLTADQLLLINQWGDFYKKIPEQTLEKIKKDVRMELVETTISEHIFNLGSKVEGKAEGFIEGELKGQIAILERLYQEGIFIRGADEIHDCTASAAD